MKKLIHGIFLLINIIAILCVFVTLAGSTVSPEKFILPAFFALFFPFTIIANILFILFWLILKRWYFLFSLIALIFTFTQIKTVFPLHTSKNEVTEEGSFSLMSYNTWMLGGFQKHTKNETNPVIEYILNADADIVCLQEFYVSTNNKYVTNEDIAQVFKKYPYKHIFYKKEGSYRKLGIATFSKYPIINRQAIDYESQQNASIYSDIVIKKDTIRFINCHLESNKLTEKDKAMPLELRKNFDAENISNITLHLSRKLGAAYKTRAKQAEAVNEVVKSSPYPVIVCGDFNDVPLSYAYTKVKGDLKDTFSELGAGFGNTFNERFYKFRIDYIFHDEGITPLDFKIDKVDYSDHYPLLSRMKTIRNSSLLLPSVL